MSENINEINENTESVVNEATENTGNTEKAEETMSEHLNSAMLDMAELEYNRYMGENATVNDDIPEEYSLPEEEIEQIQSRSVKSNADTYVISLVVGFIVGILIGMLIDQIAVCIVAGLLIGGGVGAVITYVKHKDLYADAEKKKKSVKPAKTNTEGEK